MIRITSNYHNDLETFFSFATELITPFADWRRTALELGYELEPFTRTDFVTILFCRYKHSRNMYRANCSLFWHENQHISLDVFTDYNWIGPTFTCEFSGGLSSTLHDIASLSASIKHQHNATKVESSVKIMVSWKGKW